MLLCVIFGLTPGPVLLAWKFVAAFKVRSKGHFGLLRRRPTIIIIVIIIYTTNLTLSLRSTVTVTVTVTIIQRQCHVIVYQYNKIYIIIMHRLLIN